MDTAPPSRIFFAQLREQVIRPALGLLELGDGPTVINLLLGTAAQESGGRFLRQYPSGPALGFWQIEPTTHRDVLTNFVAFRPDLRARLAALAVPGTDRDDQLAWNLRYACAIARLIYLRAPAPLPGTSDPALLGAFWKAHYNTAGGAGAADEFVRSFSTYIGDPVNV
ncbi:MAG TPA: hypothetical protein VM689_13465 [Aliidongia sp.]|nr:hypothetical protein [Aliidongia sp.]